MMFLMINGFFDYQTWHLGLFAVLVSTEDVHVKKTVGLWEENYPD